jgi:hypothetical protein
MLCDIKSKTCAMMKDNNDALKQKRFVLITTRGHGGMTCMAQKYHGHGDVNGPLRKIGNTNVNYVNEQKVCCEGREMESPKD